MRRVCASSVVMPSVVVVVPVPFFVLAVPGQVYVCVHYSTWTVTVEGSPLFGIVFSS